MLMGTARIMNGGYDPEIIWSNKEIESEFEKNQKMQEQQTGYQIETDEEIQPGVTTPLTDAMLLNPFDFP